jgi:hypothetical protein
VDESREELGKNLALPAWLELDRKEIEAAREPITGEAKGHARIADYPHPKIGGE